ncbi:MAG: hypothetical protein ACREQR_14100 [Candidatus Binataceae bacterium]
MNRRGGPVLQAVFASVVAIVVAFGFATGAGASTYVVYIPLDSAIYQELSTLDGLGYLDTYFEEIKPISRVEAARLTIEATRNIHMTEHDDPLARHLVRALTAQLGEEIGWLRGNTENQQPTMLHPLERAEVQYLYSGGRERYWRTGPNGPINAEEGTPLLPNNDGLPTAPGSNEIGRFYGMGRTRRLSHRLL